MQAPEPDIQKYEGRYREGWDPVRRARHERQLDSGLFAEDWTLAPRDERVPDWASVDDKARWDRKMATYAAMVDRMDRGIGRVLGALEAAGALDDTLVLFLSDNGAAASGIGKGDEAQPGTPESYTGYHRPWANVSDTPFRRYKIWTHEGGIATPLIARWPGEVPAGETRHLMGHVIDILPTCLDAAGASYPSTYDGRDITPTEGRSLLPAFRGEADRLHDALFWTHTDNHAVREGRWKLVTSDGRDTWSLYDMATDRTELEDRAEDRPDLVKRLARRHQTWSDRVGVLPWSEYRERRRAQS
jgi:arylsulfatase